MRRLMDIKIADSVSPEIERLVDKWNDALAATLDYMDQHPPRLGTAFTKEEDIVMNLPMNAFLAFLTPLVYDSSNTRRLKAMWLQKLDARLTHELTEYESKLNTGRVL